MKTFNRFGLTAEEALQEVLFLRQKYPEMEIACCAELPAGQCGGQYEQGQIIGYGVMRRGTYAGLPVSEGGLDRSRLSARQTVAAELAEARGEGFPPDAGAEWYAEQERLHGQAISEDYAAITWEYVAYLIVHVSDSEASA